MRKPKGIPSEVWQDMLDRSADEREAKAITGKGWTVCHHKKNTGKPWCGYARTASGRVSDGTGTPYWPTRQQAVERAIGHARKAGTLDWEKTTRWLKLMRIEIDMDAMMDFGPHHQGRGWYLSSTVTQTGHRYCTVRVGRRYEESMYLCVGSSRRSALRKAFRQGLRSEPWYDESSSVVWLRQHGFHDLIDIARGEVAA